MLASLKDPEGKQEDLEVQRVLSVETEQWTQHWCDQPMETLQETLRRHLEMQIPRRNRPQMMWEIEVAAGQEADFDSTRLSSPSLDVLRWSKVSLVSVVVMLVQE